jgi:SHS2 domain-containing protein
MKYKILEHKADIKIKVYGKNLEDIFKNAALAMAQILKHGPIQNERKLIQKKEKIKIKSIDRETLLADFLNEILAKSQITKNIYYVSYIMYRKLKEEVKLEAEIVSLPVENFDEDIKAVTYHDLSIKEKNGNLEATILFDI